MYAHERSLVQRMVNRPFALIGVNSDPLEKAQDALERENITWRSFFNGGTTGGPISQAWGVRAWPTIYVLDHAGVIRFKNVRGEAMDKAVDELMEEALKALVENVKSQDPAVRGLAAFRLGRYAVPDAVATLSPLLADSDATVQQRAAVGLALLGQPLEALLTQIRAAASDADAEVRIGSLGALAKAKDASSVSLAVQALQDPIIAVRIGAIQALGQLADPTTVPALGKMVEDAKSSVAREAAYALAAMNVPESAELLKTLAAKSDHPARVWIAVALHRIDPAGTDARIKALMADQDALTRRRTVTVLPDLKDYDPTEVFIAALEDADNTVSKAVRAFLAQSQSPKAQEALKQFYVARVDKLVPVLGDPDVRARSKAQSDLFDLGPDVAPLLMERLLQAKDDVVAASLATVVAPMRNPQVLPTVVAQLRNTELSDNRRAAFEVFARYFREELGTEALELAKNDAPDLRLSGVRILSSTFDDRGPPVLKAALPDNDLRVRVCAAVGLSRLKDAEALAVLKDLAKNADRAIQQQAVAGLANYDEETALPPILELVTGDDPALRIVAFSTLARFKSPKVTAVIVEKAAADERLQRLALSVLGQQGTADAARALGEFLKNDDMTIRRQAEQALSRIRLPEAQKILQEYRQQQAEQEKAEADAGK